ncbi:hypothetical protein HQ531_06625 [bacterium]|nr:hypothetical protein [bacterium]
MSSISQKVKNTALKILDETDWDVENELTQLKSRVMEYDLARLRIEHSEEGKHRFYIDWGESYLADKKQFTFLRNMTLPAIVIAEQQIRALWIHEEEQPRCSSIDGHIYSSDSISKTCDLCSESVPGFGACKPKVRLFVLPLLKKTNQTMIFSLSPTSIKPWREHQLKLHRSGLPVIAVVTTFELEDVKSDEHRWARVRVGVRDIASKANLDVAIQAKRRQLQFTQMIWDRDYCENGDRIRSG